MPNDLTFSGRGAAPSAAASLTRKQKAAIVVRLLRSEGMDLSLADLPDAMQVSLTREMGQLRRVSRETVKAVVEEFTSELDGIGLSFAGGLRGALSLLDGSLSASAVELLRNEAGGDMEVDAWERLSAIDAEKLANVIAEESVEIGAVALSKLKVAKAAEILGKLPGEKARRLAYAMGQTGSVSPAIVARIGSTLMEQFAAEPPRAFSGGPVERVGAVLNFSMSSTRDSVLEGLEEEDRDFAAEVRKAIFTFRNIPERVDPRDVPKIVREIDQDQLTTALAFAQENEADAKVAEFILSNMSQRMAEQLKDEFEGLGRIKPEDADKAMGDIVGVVRDMGERGEITLPVGEDD